MSHIFFSFFSQAPHAFLAGFYERHIDDLKGSSRAQFVQSSRKLFKRTENKTLHNSTIFFHVKRFLQMSLSFRSKPLKSHKMFELGNCKAQESCKNMHCLSKK